MSKIRALLTLAALSLGMAAAQPGAAQDAARITNTAVLRYDGPTGPITIPSNTVTIDVARAKRPTRLSINLLPIGFELRGMKCETVPTLSYTPAPIDAADFARAPVAKTVEPRQAVIIALDNEGGNRDPMVREISWVRVESQFQKLQLPLLETGPDTGIFAGGIPEPQPVPSACELRLDRGAHLSLHFDKDEFSFGSTYTQLIDPTGYLFDSQTGALVDGAVVTLVDESGRPATVYGDDGVSAYPSTVVSGGSVTDASGRVYDFPQGNYRFPLTAPGTYRLKVEPPADYRAPTARPRAELDALRDPRGKPFLLNSASFGEPFTLSDPNPFIADIPLDRGGETRLLLTKTASVREASPGDVVHYVVRVENRSGAAASGVELNDILPKGLSYRRGSTRGADEPTVSSDGRTLAFRVPAIAAARQAEIRYAVSINPGAPTGEAVNRVLASGSGGVTGNEAAASVRIKALLFTDGFTLIGRVTEGGCRDPEAGRRGIPGIRLMLEDGTFVATDKDGLYHIEGVRPGRHVVQIDTASIPATHEAVTCDADTRQAGSATSRFVESAGGLLQRVDFQLRPTGVAPAKAADALPVATPAADAAGDRDWLADATPGVEFLFPTVDHNPRAPVVRVVIKHGAQQRVALRINGAAVDTLAFDATDTRGEVAISRWTGIGLVPDANLLEARVLDGEGRVAQVLTRTVHVAGAPASATLVPEASRLVADGLTRPLLAIRLADRNGRPVRDGTIVPVAIAAPYRVAIEPDQDATRGLLARPTPAAVARVIGDEGLAYVVLEPTTQAGALRATVMLSDGKVSRAVDTRAWLTGAATDWMLVGFAAGTLGHDTLKTRSTDLPRHTRGKVVRDGQLAFYAKGRIKGSWLLTIAYDSDRAYDRSRGLLGVIDPDRYYTVYGDRSRQGQDAATSRKLYLRLERREFYALFGDFETGMTMTQLTRYSRTLNGVKAEYSGKRVSVAGFAAHSDEVYARDEIRGAGLTGPYRLSGRDIVPNSDKLRLEVRDRLRPERVLSATPMTRHIDYDIDPTIGTIRFRDPVLGKDLANNPVFIVVDYETYGRGKKLSAGGRAAAKLAGDAVELGVSAIRDEAQGATVAGMDLRAKLTDTTELRAEAATGGAQGIGTGQAWLAEVEHRGARLDMLAYARQQDTAFGVRQQSVVEAGTRKFGFDGRWTATDRVSLTGAAWREVQIDGPGRRMAGEARVELRRAAGTIFAGTQFAFDTGLDGQDRNSKLLTLGGTQALLGGKLSVTAQTQFAPDGAKDSVDFPARHQLMAAYRLTPAIRLIGGYEIAEGKDATVNNAQIGLDATLWPGGKVTGTLNQQASGGVAGGSGASRLYGQYGVIQSVTLAKALTLDATLDASTTVRGAIPAGAAIRPFQAGSGGSIGMIDAANNDGDYVAMTLGLTYRHDQWNWRGRLEHRRSDQNDRFGVTADVVRTLGEGKTIAAGLRYFTVTQQDGAKARSLYADVAVAWRPLDSRWSVLDRAELRSERADGAIVGRNALGVPGGNGIGQDTLRAIHNIAVNYRTGSEGDAHGLSGTVYHGAKWVRGSYGDDDYTGFIQVLGFDLRQDLGQHVDIGVQGSVQHALRPDRVAFSAGPSIGVSPAKDMWISAGYNIAGYRDRDFEDDRYTRSGAHVTMRMKFDRDTLGRMVGRK